jgi:dipeptidyl-peptidase-4
MKLGDPRDALLARVEWLPDGKRIAVQRLNRVQSELRLLFADAASGTAKEVLAERDPHWVNISHDLRFLKTREAFLWSSERDGYRHLYLIDLDGQVLQQLTRGEWEVKSVASVDDLVAVGLNGEGKRLVLPGKGQHAALLSPNGEFLIDTYSSTIEAPRKTLHRVSGESIDVIQAPPAAAKDYLFLPPETVQVKAPDGAVLYGRLVKPLDFDPARKYPAIVIVYGGPHAQSVCECWAGFGWEQALAQSGFVVWQLDNRGTAGRGHAWETKLYRRLGRQELEDQELGIRHLVGLGFVDPLRVGMYGWSYGGFMTLYTMLNKPDLVRAGIAGAPVTDWRNYDTIYTERYLGLPSANEEGYRLSSPVHHAGNLKRPLLLVHNYGDDNVLFQQSFQMMVELQKQGKLFDTMIYPQRAHGVTGSLKKHLLEKTTAFFKRELTP